MQRLEDLVKERARALGFDLVGITGAEPSAFAAEYRDWIAQGYAGEMDYLARNLERRLDPRELLPDVRSIIVVGMNYYTEGTGNREQGTEEIDERGMMNDESEFHSSLSTQHSSFPQPPTTNHQPPTFARYARGDDYHDVMTRRLKELLAFLKAQAGSQIEGADGRAYVDTGPVLEREVARRAGLGWFGKNTMLINTRAGSYFFLGEIVTNVPLEADAPAVGSCGTCRKCLDACPTNALLEPYKLDARRCLSYLTIELKGAIPEEFRPVLAEAGNRIYGCDICQEVCPINRARETARYPTLFPTEEPAFQPREVTVNSKVTDLLYMNDEEFREKFKGSPVKRAKRRGLLRNAAAALCNRADDEAVAALEHANNDPEPLVKEAAGWSLGQIQARKAKLAEMKRIDHLEEVDIQSA